jgi:hypothetical protein
MADPMIRFDDGARYELVMGRWTRLVATGLVFPASMARPNVLRFVGALGTYLFGAALCIALIVGA